MGEELIFTAALHQLESHHLNYECNDEIIAYEYHR